MSEDDALALDDARVEDSVTCEGCGATFDVAEVILSPYEADDGGAYCDDCATAEWARVVEECGRLRAALLAVRDRLERHQHSLDPRHSDGDYLAEIAEIVGSALAPQEEKGSDHGTHD